MVNEKQTKRERNIKSKLMAAIAMLLVSSIMMVSTTYAWFTLSTAPEVTGITTSIAANGNLEIALSPESGDPTKVGDATTGTNTWLLKNLTWGNLVDMSDASYGLSALTLAPAQLNASGDDTNGYKLANDGTLSTPSYGADGRISALITESLIASKGTNGAYAGPAKILGEDGQPTGEYEPFKYGVRAVGTASGQSIQQKNFKSNVNAIGTFANAGVTAASNSLTANGQALATMMVQHARAGSSDSNNYAQYVPAMRTLLADLATAVNNVEEALEVAILAYASTIANETTYNEVYGDLKEAATLDAKLAVLAGLDGVTITMPSEFNEVKTKLAALQTKISTSQTNANGLDADGTVTWNDAAAVLNNLMNTAGVKVNGYTIDDIKAKMDDTNFLLGMATNTNIELGVGSGIYYELAELTGNITAKTTATVDSGTSLGSVTLPNVMIKTTYPAGQSLLPVLKTYISTNVTAAGSATAVLDAYYGYVIDLMVRTNAADSTLNLQTAATQRVYSEGTSDATMGGGSTIIFKTTSEADALAINDLVKSIRVVFFDPTNDNKIFGIAKAAVPVITQTELETEVTVQNGETQTAETRKVIEYTITGSLELYTVSATGNSETKLNSAGLCKLTQNVPQAISAMVYLDGNNVTSADVLADENVTGALNLQFSSSATLNPMDNADLMTMGAYEVTKGLGVNGSARAIENVPYVFSIDEEYTLKSVTVGGVEQTLTPDPLGVYTIPGTSFTGDLEGGIVIKTAQKAVEKADDTTNTPAAPEGGEDQGN